MRPKIRCDGESWKFLQNEVQLNRLQARIEGIQSVLMAEAAALCLAARVAKQLSLSSVNFLTDNQSMPNFYNSRDLFNPPHWNIKT